MKTEFNRRSFLRGAGALIALPALESTGFRRFASAATKTVGSIPKRTVFMGIGFGVTKQTWYPSTDKKEPIIPKQLWRNVGAGLRTRRLALGMASWPLLRSFSTFCVNGCTLHAS